MWPPRSQYPSLFSAMAVRRASRGANALDRYVAFGLFALAIVGLHFTAMGAVWVLPLRSGAAGTEPAVLQTMAIAVAAAGLLVIGTGVASYLIDVRTRAEALERFQYLALNDALTGLPNRRSFNDHLDHELDRASKTTSRSRSPGSTLTGSRRSTIEGPCGRRSSAQNRRAALVETASGRRIHRPRRRRRVCRDQAILETERASGIRGAAGTNAFKSVSIDDREAKMGASIGIAVFPDDARDRDAWRATPIWRCIAPNST